MYIKHFSVLLRSLERPNALQLPRTRRSRKNVTVTPATPPLLLLFKPPLLSRRPHSTYRSLNPPHHHRHPRFPARSPATPPRHGVTRRRLPDPGEPHRRHHRALASLPAAAPRVGAARRRRLRDLLPRLRALRGPAPRLRPRGGWRLRANSTDGIPHPLSLGL